MNTSGKTDRSVQSNKLRVQADRRAQAQRERWEKKRRKKPNEEKFKDDPFFQGCFDWIGGAGQG